MGSIPVAVAFEGQQKQLSLLVVPGDGPTLLGLNWLQELKLNWEAVLNCMRTSSPDIETILESHSEVFGDDLGKLKGMDVTIQVDPDAPPKFFRA